MLYDIDKLYFLLRSKVLPDIGVSLIDEIYIRNKHDWIHPLEAFKYAYIDNTSFQPRKHMAINIGASDNKVYTEEGV